MHVRQQIREAVFNLIESLPNLSVFVGLSGVLGETQIPAINLLTGDEEVLKRYQQGGCSIQLVQLDVLIELYVVECSDYEDVLDTHCVNVQRALAPDTTLGGIVHGFEFSASTIARNRDGEVPYVMRALTYLSQYTVNWNDPETPL